jgi:actin-related protein
MIIINIEYQIFVVSKTHFVCEGGVAKTKNLKERLTQEINNILLCQHRTQMMSTHTPVTLPKIGVNQRPFQSFAAWMGKNQKYCENYLSENE